MSKYTPGPWRAHDHNDMGKFGNDPHDWIGYAWVGAGGDPDGKFQSKIADLNRRSDLCKEFRENAANDARLIAAAPDLADVAHMVLNTATVYTPPELVQAATEALRKAGEIPGEVGG